MNKKLKQCKACKNEIAVNAKICPNCGAKNNKPIYKRWWFVIIVIIVIVTAMSTIGNGTNTGDKLDQANIETTDIKETDNVGADTNSTKDSNSNETTGQKNALKSAKNYINTMAFSYDGLVTQLEFEKYSHEDAVYGADNCGADWKEQAAKSAKNYLSTSSFSHDSLITQLEFEGFTNEQAVYGAEANGY